MFSSGSRSSRLRGSAADIGGKKGSKLLHYFRKVKNLADTLCAIGTPLRDDEVISYMLAGLGPEFDSLVTSVTTCVDPMSLSELYAHMLSFELRLEQNNSVYQVPSANQANRNSYRTNWKGDRGRGRGNKIPGGSPNGKSSTPRSNLVHGGQKPTCQVCGKVGHDALRCYHRFDHTYQADENRVAAAAASSYDRPNRYLCHGATTTTSLMI
ncbi:hypothetical protein J5N97_005892 [Dioscorea zingiberensis]|uniref:Gag protein n=1 Tax=Dioscorea zingiberensis TaxID=325984 RepID=A0A9D5D9B2_9LILI|nr:hypothetical protein J5N97_005892 [Dioscorea zingiberensis]